MQHIDRRSFVAAMTLLPFVSAPALAASNSSKREFMRVAVEELHLRRDMEPRISVQPGGKYASTFERVCVPAPFADFDVYYTDHPLHWVADPGQTPPFVRVPQGFCTDLTSVPQLFWSLLPKTGRYAYAAIVHDYLYWTQSTTRATADNILYSAMAAIDVRSYTRWTIYSAVRLGGGSSWAANTKAKAAGEKRFLKVFPPKDRLVSWDEWRKDPSHFEDI
jgi:hypothetical protein